MRAVARLVITYFMCTTAVRVASATGIAITLVSYFTLRYLPQSDIALAVAMAGIAAFFLGSTPMPLIFGQAARAHFVHTVAAGRLKLFVSALVTTAIVSLPAPILWAGAYATAVLGHGVDPEHAAKAHEATVRIFWAIYTSAFLVASWLYLGLWFITSQRTAAGFVRGMLLLIFALYAPTDRILALDASLVSNALLIGVLWLGFAISFLGWPQWKSIGTRLTNKRWSPTFVRKTSRTVGQELDVVLGTSDPWMLAVVQVAPLLIAARLSSLSPAVWLFYLTIFSTVSGAVAGRAAERSRFLWLRSSWSRLELFAHAEQSFWRHNSYTLGVLLILLVAIGSYENLRPEMLSAGLPLLALGTALSTYLGLMVTRGLGWLEAAWAIGVMLALMTVATITVRGGDIWSLIALEICLGCAAVALRTIAKHRWAHIDWALCRPDRLAPR